MLAEQNFWPPSAGEQLFNTVFGILAGWGLGPSFVHRLWVKGRKSGKLYSTAVSLVELNGKKFLVAPRGRAQWVRNAEAAGEVTLQHGSRKTYRLRALQDSEKPEVLKKYLGSFAGAVQRFFPIPPHSPVEEFAKIASGYPVFELIPA